MIFSSSITLFSHFKPNSPLTDRQAKYVAKKWEKLFEISLEVTEADDEICHHVSRTTRAKSRVLFHDTIVECFISYRFFFLWKTRSRTLTMTMTTVRSTWTSTPWGQKMVLAKKMIDKYQMTSSRFTSCGGRLWSRKQKGKNGQTSKELNLSAQFYNSAIQKFPFYKGKIPADLIIVWQVIELYLISVSYKSLCVTMKPTNQLSFFFSSFVTQSGFFCL